MYPMELPIAVYAPGRRLVEFSIETDLKPKTLDDVVDIFDAYNANLVMGLIMGNLQEDRRIIEAFVDHTDVSIPVKELAEILKKIPGIFMVEYREGLKTDLATCRLHYPPKVLGEEAVVFRLSVLKSWFNRIWDVFGSGAANIFFEAGMEAGGNAARSFMEKFGLENEGLVRFMADICSSLGWGKITILEFNPEKHEAKIRVENLFECSLAGRTGKPQSFFFKGYLLGAAMAFFNTDTLTIEEVKCIALGDSCCEFHLKTLSQPRSSGPGGT